MRPQPASIMSGTHGLAAVERAGEVDLEDAVPLLGGDLEERAEAVEPGVVHEDRRAAEAPRATAATPASMPARSVTSTVDADGGAAGRVDLGRGLVGRVAVAVEDGDGDAVGGQPLGDGQADARRRRR